MRPIKHNALPWLVLSVVVVALDLWTKHLALAHLSYNVPVPVIEGLWNWRLVYNTGAAFSFLANAGGWQHWLFSGLAVAISALLAWWLACTPRRDWRTALPFALVIGGALGNLHDRLRWGHVVDFIDWHYAGWHWPAFNLADAAIVGGAIGILLFGLLEGKRKTDA